MSDDMLPYYERELALLHSLAGEFAEQHPKVAARLSIGRGGSQDPHVERLLQGTAFLAADIHKRLDDDFPELTDSLLDMVCPHYLRPVPSMSIVEFALDRKQASLTSGYEIPRGTELESEPVDEQPCIYQTCFNTKIWPIRISDVNVAGPPFQLPAIPPIGTSMVLDIVLEALSPKVPISKLQIDKLRFFLHADTGQSVFHLYESMLTRCNGIMVSTGPDDRSPVILNPECLVAAGFEDDEAALPEEARGFSGHRLLTEFFTLPQKYLFVDLQKIPESVIKKSGSKIHISILLADFDQNLERSVSRSNIRLGCSPVVNLFTQQFDPFTVDGTKSEYCVVPDARRARAIEVYAIDKVQVSDPGGEPVESTPFYKLSTSSSLAGLQEASTVKWMTHRRMHREPRPDGIVDGASDVWLSLVDQQKGQIGLIDKTVHTSGLCTNRNLPSRLPFTGNRPRLNIRSGQGPIGSILCLVRPTAPARVRPGQGAIWKLVSHLSLNHLSLASEKPGDAAAALREMLHLYLLDNIEDFEQKRRWIEGVRDISSSRIAARVGTAVNGVCQGVEVRVELDDEYFDFRTGFLFSSVLERFYAAWVNINSFTQLVSTSRQRDSRQEEWSWPPRSGSKVLV